MYKELTLPELKNILLLPQDYKVDAFIVYGSYDREQFTNLFTNQLDDYVTETLEDMFLRNITSIKTKNKRIWFCVEYGGARLSEYVHFASMLGSKCNIQMGSCGGLQKDVHTSSVILPTHSYATESSAHMYVRNNKSNLFASTTGLVSTLQEALTQKGVTTLTGKTMTCQGMMGETWQDIVSWSEQGYLAVEMEASTVFAVSQHFNIPTASMVHVADNLIEKEIVGSDSHKSRAEIIKEVQAKMMQAALEQIEQL